MFALQLTLALVNQVRFILAEMRYLELTTLDPPDYDDVHKHLRTLQTSSKQILELMSDYVGKYDWIASSSWMYNEMHLYRHLMNHESKSNIFLWNHVIHDYEHFYKQFSVLENYTIGDVAELDDFTDYLTQIAQFVKALHGLRYGNRAKFVCLMFSTIIAEKRSANTNSLKSVIWLLWM